MPLLFHIIWIKTEECNMPPFFVSSPASDMGKKMINGDAKPTHDVPQSH
jgi:hypothetical protein